MKKLLLILISVGLSMFVNAQQLQPSWEAPAKYKTMVQKERGDISIGKETYNKYCKSCHGTKGHGDGPRASMLKTYPGDFGAEYFKKYNYGQLYYISFVGYKEMPNFEKKIIDESDRASIIEYIKTLR